MSVVFYAQSYTVTLFFQAYPDGWLIGRIGYLFRLAEHGVAGIVHQVEYGAAEILRNNFYQWQVVGILFLYRDIETFVVCLDCMVRKPYIFFGQLMQVGRDIFVVFAA